MMSSTCRFAFSVWCVLFASCHLCISANALSPYVCRIPDPNFLKNLNQRSEKAVHVVGFDCGLNANRRGECFGRAGIGNILITYPAAYFYAVLTGRDIVINDFGNMGGWCKVLNCSFPFHSEIKAHHAHTRRHSKTNSLFVELKANKTCDVNVIEFMGSTNARLSGDVLQDKRAMRCLQGIMNCSGVGCMEKFAFQHLLSGGLRQDVGPLSVVGLTAAETDAVLRSPFSTAPRFDGAVHIRAQSREMEVGILNANRTAEELSLQVHLPVFRAINTKLTSAFFRPVSPSMTSLFNVTSAVHTQRWPRIIVSCDDAFLKKKLIEILANRSVSDGLLHLVYVNHSATQIYHTKHAIRGALLNKTHNNSLDRSPTSHSVADTALDWYLLALSDKFFAYRLRGSSLLSTFLQSASRVRARFPKTEIYMAKKQGSALHWRPEWDWSDD